MRKLVEGLKYNGLFIKMFMITLVCVVTVALSTWFVMLQMSEKVFMDTFSITNSKIINQIKTSVEGMDYAVSMTASNTLNSAEIKRFSTEGSLNTVQSLISRYKVVKEIDRLQATVSTYPISMLIVGVNGNRHSTDTSFWPPYYNELSNDPITVNTMLQPLKLRYYLDEKTLSSNNDNTVIVAAKGLVDRSGFNYGILYFAIKEEAFKKSYAGFTSEGNNVMLMNSAGQVISSNVNELIGTTQIEILQTVDTLNTETVDQAELQWEGKQHQLLAMYFPTYDLYLVNMIDKRVVLSQMMNVQTLALVCVAIVLIALLIVFVVSRKITRSLSLLARQMSRVTRRNFGNYINVSGSNEVKELGRAYNYMLDELNEYVEELIKSQKEQRHAELSALQMQINPHFLYNTLASIKILVQQGNKEKATLTIHALIELLQNTIGNASESITVEEELINLKNYVFINHIRYGEQINVSYFVDENCKKYHMPKLIIQPFIENAFFHAFRGRADGYIYVMISKEGSNLICEIVDNGVGMNKELKKREERTGHSSHFFSGIGINNVNDRLELLYGEHYGVKIVSSPEQGTRIIITMPLIIPKKSTNI